jgi:precorrin-2/cobalt-factor-2 C20-methyltransferase
VKILGKVDVIFTASSTKNDFSLALDIARPHLPEDIVVRSLSFPMTKDKVVTDKAWEANADAIAREVFEGKDVAFLTLGDPLTYSTFGYILQKLQKLHPEIVTETIPGITSYQAAAARINRPLVEAEESLLLTSGAFGGENVRKVGSSVDNVVLLKAYKNVPDIIEALDSVDMLGNSAAISKCGRENESVTNDIRLLAEREPDYWTLVIAKKEKQDKK